MSIAYEAALLATESSSLIDVISASSSLADTPRAGLPIEIPRDQLHYWTVTWPLERGAGTELEVGEGIRIEPIPPSAPDPHHLESLIRELQARDEALSITTDADERDEILRQRNTIEEELRRLAPANVDGVELDASRVD